MWGGWRQPCGYNPPWLPRRELFCYTPPSTARPSFPPRGVALAPHVTRHWPLRLLSPQPTFADHQQLVLGQVSRDVRPGLEGEKAQVSPGGRPSEGSSHPKSHRHQPSQVMAASSGTVSQSHRPVPTSRPRPLSPGAQGAQTSQASTSWAHRNTFPARSSCRNPGAPSQGLTNLGFHRECGTIDRAPDWLSLEL